MRAARGIKRTHGRSGRRTFGGAALLFVAALTLLCAAFRLAGGQIDVTLPAFSDKAADAALSMTREVVFPGETWYALQLSAHQFKDQALAAAQGDPARGAAGHVYGKDGGWRVLAAAYPARAEAQRVLTLLKEAHGVDAVVYLIERPSVTLRLRGAQAQLDSAAAAIDYLRSAAKRLSALSAAIDDRATGAETARKTLVSERATVASLLKSISATFRGEDAKALQWLTDTLASLEDALTLAVAAKGDTALGAAVKNCLLTVIAGLNDGVRAL